MWGWYYLRWDYSNGPDVYFSFAGIASATKSDVAPAQLPLVWNFTTPLEITNFTTTRNFALYDEDWPDADDQIGTVSFLFSDYTTVANHYPTSITKTQNKITVKLDLTWE